jgi:hypothetical protein
MAYVGNSLALVVDSIEGSFSMFSYQSSDNIASILATNYFLDGVERGMKVGDYLFAIVQGLPFILCVASTTGLACTVTPAVLAISGSSLPTSNPGAGSGQLWNNAGFVCVA